MLEAPKQDWAEYARRSRKSRLEWLRGLSPAAALSLHEDFHRFASSIASRREDDDQDRRDQARWRQKLALRSKLHAAFSAVDRLRDG